MPEQSKEQRDRIIAQVVQILYQAQANRWPVQDKGVLLAAIKLQLAERPTEGEQKNG